MHEQNGDNVHFHLFWTADPCETSQRSGGASAAAAGGSGAMAVQSSIVLKFKTLRRKKNEDNPGQLTLYAFQKADQTFVMTAMHEIAFSANKAEILKPSLLLRDNLKRLSSAGWEWKFIRGSPPEDRPPCCHSRIKAT